MGWLFLSFGVLIFAFGMTTLVEGFIETKETTGDMSFVGLALIFFLSSAPFIFVGRGLTRAKQWARIAGIILPLPSLMIVFMMIASQAYVDYYEPRALFPVLMTIVVLTALIANFTFFLGVPYLIFRKKARDFFR